MHSMHSMYSMHDTHSVPNLTSLGSSHVCSDGYPAPRSHCTPTTAHAVPPQSRSHANLLNGRLDHMLIWPPTSPLQADEIVMAKKTGPEGLNETQVAERLKQYGLNVLEEKKKNELLVFLGTDKVPSTPFPRKQPSQSSSFSSGVFGALGGRWQCWCGWCFVARVMTRPEQCRRWLGWLVVAIQAVPFPWHNWHHSWQQCWQQSCAKDPAGGRRSSFGHLLPSELPLRSAQQSRLAAHTADALTRSHSHIHIHPHGYLPTPIHPHGPTHPLTQNACTQTPTRQRSRYRLPSNTRLLLGPHALHDLAGYHCGRDRGRLG